MTDTLQIVQSGQISSVQTKSKDPTSRLSTLSKLLVRCGRQCTIAECRLFRPNCEFTEMHSSLKTPGSFLVTIFTNASAMFLFRRETFGRPIFYLSDSKEENPRRSPIISTAKTTQDEKYCSARMELKPACATTMHAQIISKTGRGFQRGSVLV